MSDMERKIQEIRQRMARQTGNQVVMKQNLRRRISEIRAQVGIHNADLTQPAFQQSFDNVTSPFARRQSSNYSMQGEGLFDQTTSFGTGYQLAVRCMVMAPT